MLSAFFYPDRTARRMARLEGKSTASHPVRIPPVRRPRPLRRRKAQHLSRRWTFPPFCTTMIFAREDIPPPRTHAPVAQLDRVSDSDSEGHRFDSCRVYHNSRRVTRREFLLSRAGVLPFADAVCAAAALFPAPHPVDPRHGNKLPRTSFTFTAQPRYSVLAPLRPYDSCRVYHNSRRVTRREFLLSRAGVLPFADAVCAAAALFPAPHPVDPRHGNKLPRTSFTFTAQPRYSVLAPLRPYDSCRVYHTGIIRTRSRIRGSYYSLQRTFSALFR